MIRKRQIVFALIKRIFLPGFAGTAIGFLVVFWLLGGNQEAGAAPVMEPPRLSASPDRATVLLLDRDGDEPVGVWQWWSQPWPSACIVPDDKVIQPQSRMAGEIMSLAMKRGDDSWVALAADTLARSCGSEPAGGFGKVLFIQPDGFRAIVAALGGIDIHGQLLGADAAWQYVQAGCGSTQQHGAETWLALAASMRQQSNSICEVIQSERDWFRSYPPDGDACEQFELVMTGTPGFVLVP